MKVVILKVIIYKIKIFKCVKIFSINNNYMYEWVISLLFFSFLSSKL